MVFNLFNKKKKIGGNIAFYHLEDWWLSTFTEKERKHIQDVYGSSLIEGEILSSTSSPLSFLTALATWFDNSKDRIYSNKILDKAQDFTASASILDLHFFYSGRMKVYYKDRDNDSKALDKAIEYCKKQIDIADKAADAFRKEFNDKELPRHEGYEQLCIILEKQGKYDESIKLAEQAKKQGWGAGWDQRIENCRKKLSKTSK